MESKGPVEDLIALREADMRKDLRRLTGLIDELKLVSLNLAVAQAKLRLRDRAFQAVGSSFKELLDSAARSTERAESLIERAHGRSTELPPPDDEAGQLEVALETIQRLAERIVQTVEAIKRGRGIDKRL
jgi:CRISPR/Cas system-associated protein Cas5 (RAMP superfamily)